MARTLIWNITADTQTLPEVYGSTPIDVRRGYVTSDDITTAVANLGGFEGMTGLWCVLPISVDEELGERQVFGGSISIALGSSGLVPWGNVTGKPSFATVATSGNYNHLTNKPVLAAVATAGSYDSLTGKPTVPALTSTAAVAVTDGSGSAGSATDAARSDHTHSHGLLSGGDLHAVAGADAGFMSAADKAKLDSVAANAAANTSAAPQPVGVAAAVGTETTSARADHVHAHGAQTDGSLHAAASSSTAGFMSASDKSKLDGVAASAAAVTGSVSPVAVAAAAAVGTSSEAARADHAHTHGNQVGGSLHAVASGTAAGFMSSAHFSKLEGVAASAAALGAGTPASVGAAAAAGDASTAAPFNHVHAHGSHTDAAAHAIASGSANGFMSKEDKSKLDGVAASAAALTTAVPLAVGTAAQAGTGTTAARADHVHAHGAQTDGTLHALATSTVAGFMSAAHFTKVTNAPLLATAGTPEALGTAALGNSTSAAPFNHVHAHGDLAGGSLHAAATSSAAGFMSAADKTKLDAISRAYDLMGYYAGETPDAGTDMLEVVVPRNIVIEQLFTSSDASQIPLKVMLDGADISPSVSAPVAASSGAIVKIVTTAATGTKAVFTLKCREA